MGLLQKAVETYEVNKNIVGLYYEGHEPLAPVSHIVTKADIEIMLDSDGKFISARERAKDEPKIIIPATEESAGRTNNRVLILYVTSFVIWVVITRKNMIYI